MKNRRIQALQLFLASLVPLVIGLAVHRQGFNLLDDGLWLLGTRVLVDGGVLYGDIFSIYGPARYFLLAPFFLVLGPSALTLAVFKAVLDGAASGFGWWYTRRLGAGRWSWLVPLGVVAFGPVHPRYFAAALFAALVGSLLKKSPTLRTGIFAGAAWGALSLFGLDMAGYGAVILAGGWGLSRGSAFGPGAWRRFPISGVAAGLGAVLGIGLLVSWALGVLDAAIWDTVIYPVTRFGDAMGVAWYRSFQGDPQLHQPFAGQFTGESLPGVWAGHAWHRTTAIRLMFLLVWLVPAWFLWNGRRSGDPRLGPLVAVAVAGWVTLMGRGDVFHLRLIWFSALLLMPVLLARQPGGRWVRGSLGVLFILMVAAPLAAEKAWLAANLQRPGLVRWERDTAGIYLAEGRANTLEIICAELPWDGKSPVLVWPAQPGLQFALGAPLATAQTTLLGGEVRDDASLLAGLDTSRPSAAILGSAWGLVSGASDIRGLAPEAWGYLRRNFHYQSEYLTEDEIFYSAVRANDAGRQAAGSPNLRLPGIAQQTTAEATAAIGAGVSVAQSFRVEDFDLGSVELLFRCPGPFPYPISFMVTFSEIDGNRLGRRLLQFPFQVSLMERTKKLRFSFPVLPETVGKTVLMDITGHPDGTRPFSLLWNKATAEVPTFVDYYPEGQAYFQKKPVEADLYFVTY